jgi:hypothetical protein
VIYYLQQEVRDMEDRYKVAIDMAHHILTAYVELGNDILKKVTSEYDRKRFNEFRIILITYIRIAINNAEAALHLIKGNYIHQIHYINRNMIEMVANLAYICKSSFDKNKASIRFVEFDVFLKIKQLKQVEKYPDILFGLEVEEAQDFLEESKRKYIDKYGDGRHETWSGKSLHALIDEVEEPEFKKSLKKLYDITTTIDNQYLHANMRYILDIITGKSKEASNRLLLLEILAHYMDIFIYMYFESDFAKGRPGFAARREKLLEDANSLLQHKLDTGIAAKKSK